MKALKMEHAIDPAREIVQKMARLDEGVEIVNPYELLVAIYQRPDKTHGGIYLTDKARQEDIWQGKVGLVIKMGELAFSTDQEHKWPKKVPQVGDWVAFRVGDSWPFVLGEQHCRMLQDRHVRLILTSPDEVY